MGFDDIVDKLGDVVDTLLCRALVIMVSEDARMIFFDKGDTAGTWPDDVVIALEEGLKAFGELQGIALEPRIGHRLSATRLIQWIVHIQPQPLEELVASYAYIGVHGIDVAGDK